MKAAPFVILLFLVSCSSRPEVAACEEYLKGGLGSPSGYKQTKLQVFDNRLPTQAWEQLRSTNELSKSSLRDELFQRYAREGGLRVVGIEYDAPNAFGTPIRAAEICRFVMKSFEKNKFYGGDPKINASISSSERALVSAGIAGHEAGGCCLSRVEESIIGAGTGEY